MSSETQLIAVPRPGDAPPLATPLYLRGYSTPATSQTAEAKGEAEDGSSYQVRSACWRRIAGTRLRFPSRPSDTFCPTAVRTPPRGPWP